MSREIQCPNCGHRFFIKTRAKLGQGTQRGKLLTTLSKNKQNILNVLRGLSPRTLSVRELQKILYDQNIKRYTRKDRETPTGQWNYHLVQAELSILVGAGYVKMTKGSEERWDGQRFIARPVPKYYVEQQSVQTQIT
jgi:hypothetical protein